MGKLKVLFIGGSGVISSACARVAVESGIDLYVLNRGQNSHAAVAGRGARDAGGREEPRVRSGCY